MHESCPEFYTSSVNIDPELCVFSYHYEHLLKETFTAESNALIPQECVVALQQEDRLWTGLTSATPALVSFTASITTSRLLRVYWLCG